MARSKRTDRSRGLILDAAEQAFREHAFDNVTVEQIAERAGLARKTVYNLFNAKEEIARELIARVESQDAPYRRRIKEGDNALTLLEAILADSARWCRGNPTLARLALSPMERPSYEPPSGRPSFQALVRDVLLLGQRQQLFAGMKMPISCR